MNRAINYLLVILFSLLGLLFSCETAEEKEGAELIQVDVNFNIATGSANQTRASASITDPQQLDSLIKNIRILTMDDAGVCESYADFNPAKLSEGNTFKIASRVGIKSFIFITNAADWGLMSNPTGKTAAQILIPLVAEKIAGNYMQYHPAPQLFWSQLDNVLVQSGTMPIETTIMQRIVSQLETSVYKQAYHTDANGNKTTPFASGYIQRLDSIYIYSISPDISLSKGINNRSGSLPKYDLTNSLIASSQWENIGLDKDQNITISFPTEGQNMRPYLVLAAEVDPANSDFTPSVTDRTGPYGGVLRYWSFLLKQYHLTPNKRLLVDITALLGGGSPTPVPPPDTLQVQFNIEVKDWELLADTIIGDKDDFLP